MSNSLFELAIVIFAAAGLGVLAKFLKQPILLAYLLTGLLIGYFDFFNLADKETFRLFSDLGIMFLLFLIGLEINYSSLRLVGKPAALVGIGQIVFTSALGFLIALAFGFNNLTAAYIAVALTFSSTVIIIKLLSEKKDLNSLYGKISVGFLLIQDFVAVIILVFLTGIKAGGEIVASNIFLTFIKGAVLFTAMVYLGKKIIPLLFDKISRSQELLFLFSLAWVFAVAALVGKIGFPLGIGGFLAGLALSNSSEHFQIAGRVKTLRDFFIMIFFAILGSSLVFSNLGGLIFPIAALSLFVLVGNPLIVVIIMWFLGYRKRTSFLTGLTTAQISEFSLILAATGMKIGHIDENTTALITAVGAITITLSSYLIIYADDIFRRLSPYLSFFERKNLKEDGFQDKEFNKPIILIGAHRTGQSVAFNMPKEDLLVIDFDPDIIAYLKKRGYEYIFGDIADDEIFEKANFKNAKIVISTSPDVEDNLTLLSRLKNLENRKEIKVVLRAREEETAKILYKAGADYVLLPHFTAGQYLGKTISVDKKAEILEQLKSKDLELLTKINGELF